MKKPEWLERALLEVTPYTLCTSKKQFKKLLKSIGCKDQIPFILNEWSSATAHFFDGATIVCLDKKKAKARLPEEVFGLLVHEAVHIWQHFKEQIGESNPGYEQEAYAIQRISQSLIFEYNRQTK